MVNHGFPKVFPMVILDNWLIIGYPNLEPLSPDLAAPRRRSAWKKWRKLPPPAPLGGESVWARWPRKIHHGENPTMDGLMVF